MNLDNLLDELRNSLPVESGSTSGTAEEVKYRNRNQSSNNSSSSHQSNQGMAFSFNSDWFGIHPRFILD